MKVTFFEAYDHLPQGLNGIGSTGYGLAKLAHQWSIFTSQAPSLCQFYVKVDPKDNKPAGYVYSLKGSTTNGGQGFINLAAGNKGQLVASGGFVLSIKVRVTAVASYVPTMLHLVSGSSIISIPFDPQEAPTQNANYYTVTIVVGKGNTPRYDVYYKKKLRSSGTWVNTYVNSLNLYIGYPLFNSNGHTYTFECYFRDLMLIVPEGEEDPKPIDGITIEKYTPSLVNATDLLPTVLTRLPNTLTPQEILSVLPIGSNAQNGQRYIGWSAAGGSSRVWGEFNDVKKDRAVLAVWPVTQVFKNANLNAFLRTRLEDRNNRLTKFIELNTLNQAVPFNTPSSDSPNPTYNRNWDNQPWTSEQLRNTDLRLEWLPSDNAGVRITMAMMYVVYGDVSGLVTDANGIDSVKNMVSDVTTIDIKDIITVSSPVADVTTPNENTKLVVTAINGSGYRGSYSVFYNRRELLDIIPFGFALPANVTTSHELIPYLNAVLGIILETGDLTLTTRSGQNLTLEASANSYFLIPGSAYTVSA